MFIQPTNVTKGLLGISFILISLFVTRQAQCQTTPHDVFIHYQAQATTPADAKQGQVFFIARHGGDWSCATCHGSPPTSTGKHATTGKSILALAPAANAKALTDLKRTEKWFRRNCRDVLSRECTAQEKADVVSYLLTLKLN